MLESQYKYLVITVTIIFVGITLLPLISQSSLCKWWNILAISFILICYILTKYGYKIKIRKDEILFKNIFNKNEIFKFQNIRKMTISNDPFFYSKTISIRIYTKDVSSRVFHIGTLSASQVPDLISIIGKEIETVDLTKPN